MARTDPQVNFRIPAELKDKLDQAAKDNGRTLTAELILRLEETFNDDGDVKKLHEKVENLEYQVDEFKDRFERLEKEFGIELQYKGR